MMRHLRNTVGGAASLLLFATVLVAGSAQKTEKPSKDKESADPKRPKFTLKANPLIAMAPARVVLTAELVGGDDDFEEFYCPAVEWEWGDGTRSESSTDCAPYEQEQAAVHGRTRLSHRTAQRLPRQRPSETPRPIGRHRDRQYPGPTRSARRFLKAGLKAPRYSGRAKVERPNPTSGH
jgi:hypothetical protein